MFEDYIYKLTGIQTIAYIDHSIVGPFFTCEFSTLKARSIISIHVKEEIMNAVHIICSVINRDHRPKAIISKI